MVFGDDYQSTLRKMMTMFPVMVSVSKLAGEDKAMSEAPGQQARDKHNSVMVSSLSWPFLCGIEETKGVLEQFKMSFNVL